MPEQHVLRFRRRSARTILELCGANEPEYIAQVALFARAKGYMKDMPALLCAVLSVRSPGLLAEIFDRVIDSPKMLRNFVQIMRSGVVGRKSLGTLPKRLILQWLENRTDEQLFSGSVGNDPSLADVIKMVHPKPKDASREALYAYLIGRTFKEESLPEIVKQYEAFKRNTNPGKVKAPDVPFPDVDGSSSDKERLAADCSERIMDDDSHEP
jgi:60 kDa SS-A/Ro ribonucleoprotein